MKRHFYVMGTGLNKKPFYFIAIAKSKAAVTRYFNKMGLLHFSIRTASDFDMGYVWEHNAPHINIGG